MVGKLSLMTEIVPPGAVIVPSMVIWPYACSLTDWPGSTAMEAPGPISSESPKADGAVVWPCGLSETRLMLAP